MNLKIEKKIFLITGASRGIGASIAETMLNEGAGVILVSRDKESLYDKRDQLKAAYPNSIIAAIVCDCTDEQSVQAMRREVADRFDFIHGVIANIGDGRSNNEIISGTEQWKKVWAINFDTALFVVREFLHDLEISCGSVLFISSIAGLGAIEAPIDYATSKSAIVALSKNLAHKVAPKVRVNTIAPGNIISPGGVWDVKMREKPNEVNKMLDRFVPMKRLGTPDDISAIAAFLCSPLASFITGSTIVVDGGQLACIF